MDDKLEQVTNPYSATLKGMPTITEKFENAKHIAWQVGYGARQPEIDALKAELLEERCDVREFEKRISELEAQRPVPDDKLADAIANWLGDNLNVRLSTAESRQIVADLRLTQQPSWQDRPGREGWWIRADYYKHKHKWGFTSVLIAIDDIEKASAHVRWQFIPEPEPPKEANDASV